MSKSELVEAIAKQASLTKADSARAVEAFTDAIKETLKAGKKVTLVGFGTFVPSSRKARIGRNPKTGEPVNIKASIAVTFKAGSNLKAAVNS